MYLQSPYYNSSFWDLFRQFYDRKITESQKLRIFKDQHSNSNNINEKAWAWGEKNQKGNVISLWLCKNLTTCMNKEIFCHLLRVIWKRCHGHLCISGWAHTHYSLETLSAVLAITFFCSHHQTYGWVKKKQDNSLCTLMVLGRAPKKIATLHCFSFPWLLQWYILSCQLINCLCYCLWVALRIPVQQGIYVFMTMKV